jgi:hypothetical protein
LDGSQATTHWGDIHRLEQQYPRVKWVRGVRYVDNGNIITSAGLTSGIDATLHVLAKLKGRELAQHVAHNLRYPSYAFAEAPSVQQYDIDLKDALYLLNAAYQWERPNTGVLLYNGVSELALAAVFDTYAASFTTNTLTLAPFLDVITSKHGLQFVPRWNFENAPRVERLLVPGKEARQVVTGSVAMWEKDNRQGPVKFLHTNLESFILDAPLEDLARQANVPTAAFAAKRLEYRADTIQLVGASYPTLVILRPLSIGVASLVLVLVIERLMSRFRIRRIILISSNIKRK